jgi:hypothetical protein
VALIAFGLVSKCANWFDGVSQEQETLAKNILLERYPTFETDLQQQIRSAHPAYTGVYGYDFEAGNSESIVIVKYGTSGINWFEFLNPFNNRQTTEISYSFGVNLQNRNVTSLSCVPQGNQSSSEQISCGN